RARDCSASSPSLQVHCRRPGPQSLARRRLWHNAAPPDLFLLQDRQNKDQPEPARGAAPVPLHGWPEESCPRGVLSQRKGRMSFFTNLRADRLVTEIRSSNNPASPATQKAIAK